MSTSELRSSASHSPYDLSGDPLDPSENRLQDLHELAARLKMRGEDLDVLLRSGFTAESMPQNPQTRRSMVEYIRKRETAPPKWMVISGMFPELGLDLAERRKRVRALYTSTVLLIRRELKRHEVDEFRHERSVFWDPVVEVCRELEISQSKLSSFCKELTGNSLTQVIDSVRAESVKRKLREEIKNWFSGSRFQVGSRFRNCKCPRDWGTTLCIFGNGKGG